jgi:predicted TIM-barrel fold metal-dependent hydrolase
MTIDVNISLFQYPTRRWLLDETKSLVEFLKSKGVTQAWAGSFEGLLHNDVAAVNERLAAECRKTKEEFLIPFGTVNPQLPDWEDDLRRCHEVHGMRGIRLSPNYHGYGLDSPNAASLLKLANDRKLIVQIPVRMEDPRTQHRLLSVPDIDMKPLISILESLPQLRVVIVNGLMSLSTDLQSRLVQAGRIYFDIATLEGIGGITRLMKTVPADRILFGSHAPFFVWESAELKLKESPLPEPFVEQFRRTNAIGLLQSQSP